MQGEAEARAGDTEKGVNWGVELKQMLSDMGKEAKAEYSKEMRKLKGTMGHHPQPEAPKPRGAEKERPRPRGTSRGRRDTTKKRRRGDSSSEEKKKDWIIILFMKHI